MGLFSSALPVKSQIFIDCALESQKLSIRALDSDVPFYKQVLSAHVKNVKKQLVN